MTNDGSVDMDAPIIPIVVVRELGELAHLCWIRTDGKTRKDRAWVLEITKGFVQIAANKPIRLASGARFHHLPENI